LRGDKKKASFHREGKGVTLRNIKNRLTGTKASQGKSGGRGATRLLTIKPERNRKRFCKKGKVLASRNVGISQSQKKRGELRTRRKHQGNQVLRRKKKSAVKMKGRVLTGAEKGEKKR